MSKGRATDLARGLRRGQTDPEGRLWEHLRDRRLCGLKFRRQHPLFGYIVDFYCSTEALVIELDGDPHMDPEQATYDRFRDEQLRSHKLRVLRISNSEVERDLKGVLARIHKAAGQDDGASPPARL